MPLRVEVVSPEQVLYSGEGSMVIARTVGGGEVGFQPGHTPFLGALDIASLRVLRDDGSEEAIAVHGGFVEVSNDRVTVLSDAAELAGDIDVARAEQARGDAQTRLRAQAGDPEAQADLKRAEVRIHVAGYVSRSH